MKKLRIIMAVTVILTLTACGIDGSQTQTGDGSMSAPVTAVLVSGAASDYVIIRPAEPDEYEFNAAILLRDGIREACGVTLEIKADLIIAGTGYAETPHEILIGNVNRGVMTEVYAGFKYTGDYTAGVRGDKIVIAGNTPGATYRAAEAFAAQYLTGDTPELILSDENNINYSMVTSIDSISIAGNELSGFTVVSGNQGALISSAIDALTSSLGDSYGHILPVSATESDGYNFRIGGESVNDAELRVRDGDIYLLAKDTYSLYLALLQLADGWFGTGSFTMNEGESRIFDFDYTPSSVMSFNILGGERTAVRMKNVLSVITENMPDSFGIQEGKPAWIDYLGQNLSGIYSSVGEGNAEEGYKEATFNNIYYNKFKYELLEGKTVWMSAAPDTPGTKYGESKRVRTLTWAKLRSVETGETVVHINTHLDNSGDEARQKQMLFLLELISSFDCPVMVTADFNMKITNGIMQTALTENGKFRTLYDARTNAAVSSSQPTYTGMGTSASVIDHILFTKDFTVETYRVHSKLYNGEYPSDHNASVATFTIGG